MNKNCTRILFTILCIITILMSLVLPSGALSSAGSASYYDNSGSSNYIVRNPVSTIKSINDMTITWGGISVPSSPYPAPYTYVPRNIINGICESYSGSVFNPQFHLSNFTDDISVSGSTSFGVSSFVQSSDIGGSTISQVDLNSNPDISVTSTKISDGYNTWFTMGRYLESCSLDSQYFPTSVTFSCDRYILNYDIYGYYMPSDWYGLGGIILPADIEGYRTSNVIFDFYCDVRLPDNTVDTYYGHTYLSNISGDSFYLPMIPKSYLTNIYNEFDYGAVVLENIVATYTLAGNGYGSPVQIPTSSVGRTDFSFTVVHDIIVGDNEVISKASSLPNHVIFNDYNLLERLWARRAILQGDAYNRGYADGRSVGYSSGLSAGYAEGQNNPTQTLRDQIYQSGYNSGYDDGVGVSVGDLSPTKFIGNAVSGFLDVPLFGNFSIGGLLSVVVALALVIAFLKFFAGG